jgi:putative spermidine/putrescine transport system ATP-binding protein
MGLGGSGSLRAQVRDVVFRGSYFAYELTTEGREAPIFAYSQTRQTVPENRLVDIGWQPEGAVVLQDAP